MPEDTQIFVGDNQAGSSDYQIPGNAEIRVKAVSANFVDNGAGADWLPAVVMFSDSGSVIARALLPDVKVTAGGDAEVSFFPGVKPGGAAAAATSLPCAFADITNAFVLPAWGGVYSVATWDLMDTNDSSVFSWPSGGDSTKIHLAKPGYYRVAYQYQTSGTNFPAGPGTIISRVVTSVVGSTSEVPSVNATTGALYRGDFNDNPPWGPISERLFRIGAAQDVRLFMAWQSAGGSATINTVAAFLYRLGDG